MRRYQAPGLAVSDKWNELARQPLRIERCFVQPSRSVVAHDLGDAATSGRHNRHSSGHGLEQDGWKGIDR